MVMMIHEMEVREEGREEGKILGTIETMRDDGKDDQAIITRIINKYGLTKEEAERYVLPTAIAAV